MTTSRRVLEDLFEGAGIQVNGDRPWDIQVFDDRFYGRVFRDGSLGLGESYMLGWWDASDLDELAFRAMRLAKAWDPGRADREVTGIEASSP